LLNLERRVEIFGPPQGCPDQSPTSPVQRAAPAPVYPVTTKLQGEDRSQEGQWLLAGAQKGFDDLRRHGKITE